MPPKRSTRKTAAAAAAPPPPPAADALEGCYVAISGTFDGVDQQQLKTVVADLGGSVTSSVTAKTTHLVTTQFDFDKPTAKVKSAQDKGLHIVSVDWLLESQEADARKPEASYVLGAAVKAAASNGTSKAPAKRAASPDSDGSGSDTKPAIKKAKTDSKAAKAAPAPAKAAAPAPAPAPKAKAAAPASGRPQIPLDEGCPLITFVVYIDDANEIWDASLNQTNASNNNNKFYRIQLLQNGANEYKTWTRWGRVGERGQMAVLGDGTLADAIKQYKKKFKDKSGLAWEDRASNPRPGKYAFIERSYDPDSDDDGDDDANPVKKEERDEEEDDYTPPQCKLEPEVQELMELIFNQKYFAATMSDLNYDANKMPLGKLSKTTIARGFQALKDLAELLDDNDLAQAKYDTNLPTAIENLSNLYYSVIPHAFGRNRPPVINEYTLLKKEIELLESLSDMKDAELIMKVDKSQKDKKAQVHVLDRQYEGLGMDEMTALDHSSAEFAQLKDYLTETRGATHNANYKVEQIFRIERRGEFDRFNQSVFGSHPVKKRDRRLLWHGSRVTNFGGILSQGLRIAPANAPTTGYMFGKGIYLADMSSKSANYCYSYTSGGTALLLLCEAELGNPMWELTDASYNAGDDAKAKGLFSTWGKGQTGPKKWKDAGKVHPTLKGVKLPDVAVKPGNTDVDGAYLLYNEYIAYDVAQVKLRYLFRVKM